MWTVDSHEVAVHTRDHTRSRERARAIPCHRSNERTASRWRPRGLRGHSVQSSAHLVNFIGVTMTWAIFIHLFLGTNCDFIGLKLLPASDKWRVHCTLFTLGIRTAGSNVRKSRAKRISASNAIGWEPPGRRGVYLSVRECARTASRWMRTHKAAKKKNFFGSSHEHRIWPEKYTSKNQIDSAMTLHKIKSERNEEEQKKSALKPIKLMLFPH